MQGESHIYWSSFLDKEVEMFEQRMIGSGILLNLFIILKLNLEV